MKKLAIGINSNREVWHGCCYGLHAEVDAIKHLKPRKGKGRNIKKKNINLLVIRVNKNGNLKNSKPCIKCLFHMSNVKYYKIKYVYYSNNEGQLIEEKLSDLLSSEEKHISSRFRC